MADRRMIQEMVVIDGCVRGIDRNLQARIAEHNDREIEELGVDADLVELSDPRDPTILELQWLVWKGLTISAKKDQRSPTDETFAGLCRRLGVNENSMRCRVKRAKNDPGRVMKIGRGRPSRQEQVASAERIDITVRMSTGTSPAVRFIYSVSTLYFLLFCELAF